MHLIDAEEPHAGPGQVRIAVRAAGVNPHDWRVREGAVAEGVIRELVELTGDPQKVISIADLAAPEFGVRFSGVAGSMPEALAEAAGLISRGRLHIPVEKSYTLAEALQACIDSQAGHTRGRRVMIV
ncbi:zinc-binding dehydrogenase [Nonomuraea sp. B10E15]|uniref:zinc-binding dehydrogenase n=1 Tax=Nonomuraea sp. B10E15 TaxID=3153560 RepID=UPI00325F5A27